MEPPDFSDELNALGYPFQYAVTQAFHRSETFEAVATEFPVSYRGQTTHIDLIAQSKQYGVWLVCECKRVNPAYGSWGFVQAPFTFRDRETDGGWFEQLIPPGEGHHVPRTAALTFNANSRVDTYHIAVDARSKREDTPGGKEKGSASGTIRSLAQAMTQVQKGVNGLISVLPEQKHLMELAGPTTFVPVIFTTAKLYVSDVDLAQTNLTSGLIEPATFREQPWVFFEQNVSPDLAHALQRDRASKANTLSKLLQNRYARSTIIVTASEIDRFLQALPRALHFLK